MSNRGYWIVVSPKNPDALDFRTKSVLARTFSDTDGSMKISPIRLCHSHLTALKAIRVATDIPEVEADIANIMEGIQEYGAVDFWIDE